MNTLTSREQPHHKSHYIPVRYDKTCECCGTEYEAHNIRSRFCEKKCADVFYRRQKGQDARLEPKRLACVICGKQFDTLNATKKTCSDECSAELRRRRNNKKTRAKHTWEEHLAIVRDRAKRTAEKRKIEKAWYNAIHTVERECEICGTLFCCLDTESKKTCSPECSKKLTYIKKDKRIPKAQRKDNISLKRLYKRDNGICYLCGEKCDWNSWNISKNGYKYPGKEYPTIDHVIPISRGGLDAWDNVRLAHWKCNLKKSDGIIQTKQLTREFAYSQRYKQSKETAQYTLDGDLIHIWESTAQIKRELGFSDKRIQDACRKYKTETGNAYGYHWEYTHSKEAHHGKKGD